MPKDCTRIFHWLPVARFRAALERDCLPGLWRHHLPSEGCEKQGACLSEDPTWWHRPGSNVCLMLDAAELPPGRTHHINAQKVWDLTAALRALSPLEAHGLSVEARKNRAVYELDADEWFIVGGLDRLRRRLRHVVCLGVLPPDVARSMDAAKIKTTELPAALTEDFDAMADAVSLLFAEPSAPGMIP